MNDMITRATVRLIVFLRHERGGNLLEYSLLLAFIALASIFAITQIGEKTLSNASSVLPGISGTP